jgi:predicted ATPase
MPVITFGATSFRTLSRFSWTPEPLSVIVGPNGAGKTTILDLVRFLQRTFLSGHEAGFRAIGGDHFLSRGCDLEEVVVMELQVDDLRWRLQLPMSAAGLKGAYGEELLRGDDVILRAGTWQETWYLGDQPMPRDDTRCCARVVWDRGDAPWLRPLYNTLYDLRAYDFRLDLVAEGTTREDAAGFLHGTGKNLWAVLANWKQAPLRYRGQFEWVMAHARRAFPDLLGTIEFENHEALVFPPDATDPADGLPPRRQPGGLLTGLLQLTAVAGAKPGSIIAFDEMENQLHPHAIRTILTAIGELAEERGLTVILTTHSPVVVDCFREHPERVFVLERDAATQPVALTKLKNPEWLSMFSLGDLYTRLRFGSPPVPTRGPNNAGPAQGG